MKEFSNDEASEVGYLSELESSHCDESMEQHELVEDPKSAIRRWAIKHNIRHTALKDIIAIIIKQYGDYGDNSLPMDPRTLLQTPRNTKELIKGYDRRKILA